MLRLLGHKRGVFRLLVLYGNGVVVIVWAYLLENLGWKRSVV